LNPGLPKITLAQSEFLDLARWVAALLVVFEHARNLAAVDYQDLPYSSVTTDLVYFFSGFGHEAVVIFFVISGYLVGGKALDDFARSNFDWKFYFIARVSRLYPVLLFALILTALLDFIGLNYLGFEGLYSGDFDPKIAVLPADIKERLGFVNFVGNFFMLQTIAVPPFGSNGPLWSLAYEWWYYFLFPAIIQVFHGPVRSRIYAVVVVVLIFSLLTPHMLKLFPLWLMGALCWRFGLFAKVNIFLACGLMLLGALGMRFELTLLPFGSLPINQYLLGFGVSALLLSFRTTKVLLPCASLSRHLAAFSYSLYLIHFPITLFCIGWYFQLTGATSRMYPADGVFIVLAVIVLINISAAYLLSLITEKKTNQIRRWLLALTRKSFH